MSKLDKIKALKDQAVTMPDVTKVIRIHARPDRYAIWIGKAVAFVLAQPRYRAMMPPEVFEIQLAFLKEVTNSERWRKKINNPGFRARLEKLEERLFPGILTHMVLRKRRIEEWVRKELERGCTQVVSFGAGYDTLLPRLADEFPGVQFIEVDLAPSQKSKVSVLKTRARNMYFVEANLQEPYLDKLMLEGSPFLRKQRTFFLAEGLLYWLEDDDVERLLTFMQDNCELGSRFAFSFLERGVDHRAFFPEVGFLSDVCLRLLRINFGWGVRIEHVARYLNDRYFGLIEVDTPQDLREKSPVPLPKLRRSAVGDYLAISELVFIDTSPTGTEPKL